MLENLKKIQNEIFIEENCDLGLFSYTRDMINNGDKSIIEKMINCNVLNITSYELTEYNPLIEYLSYINLKKFKEYPNESFATINQKICAYNYFSLNYKIEFNENSLFYIPELKLHIVHDNQSISNFIKLCMIKDIKIGIISAFKNDSIIGIPNKLALRIINIKNVFNIIYDENTKFAIKSSKKRNEIPLIELNKNVQKRYNLIRSYELYKKQLLMELKEYEVKQQADKSLPKFNYTEQDIDNICENFILKIKKKEEN